MTARALPSGAGGRGVDTRRFMHGFARVPIVTRTCDVLLLAAFPPELAALRSTLGDDLRGPVGALDVAARAVGIGLVASAVGAAASLDALRPRAVVLLGTCGVYPGAAIAPLGVAVARKLRLVEPSVVERRASFPDPMAIETDADPALSEGLRNGGGAVADVATTLAVTTDDALAALLASGAAVEHLEAFAVASACAASGVPFAAALGVANVVGSEGRAQWRAQHRVAADAAIQLVLAWLAAGGPGLARR